MANSIFIKADELAKELDISQGLAYKMIAKWNEELKAKGYTTVGGRVSRSRLWAHAPGTSTFSAICGRKCCAPPMRL